MDKNEYSIRLEEIKTLIANQKYVDAAAIADTIDWRRVKKVMTLCTISDLYKINRRLEDARDVLLLAYDRHPGGRFIVYALCELSIKMGSFVEAVEYYKEFVQVAPKDSGRYVLQYKLYEAQEVSLEERIEVLEELKSKDYSEKWAYELAYLYHRVGLGTKCVEECDELILWFGEGKYVQKAMELKQLHAPLTDEQQAKYYQMQGIDVSEEYYQGEELQGAEQSETDWLAAPTKEIPQQDIDIQVKLMNVGQYDTINIQKELAQNMKELLGETSGEAVQGESVYAEPAQEESVQDEPAYEEPVQEGYMQDEPAYEESVQEGYVQDEPAYEESVQEGYVQDEPAYEEPVQEEFMHGESAYGELVQEGIVQGEPVHEKMVQDESVQDKSAAAAGGYKETAGRSEMAAEAGEAERTGTGVKSTETKDGLQVGKKQEQEKPTKFDKILGMEYDGQISMLVPDFEKVEKQITGQIRLDEVLVEWEKIKKNNEQKRMEAVRQHVKEQTGAMFTEFEAAARDGLLEQLESDSAALPQEAHAGEETEAVKAGTEETAGQEALSVKEMPEEASEADRYEPEETGEADGYEPEGTGEAGGYEPEEMSVADVYGEEADEVFDVYGELTRETDADGEETGGYDDEADEEIDEYEGDADEEADGYTGDADEEETGGYDDEADESEKTESGGEEISEADGDADEPKEDKDGAAATGEAEGDAKDAGNQQDTPKHEGSKVRSMSPEERQQFGHYLQSKATKEQIVYAIDNISMAAYTGNVIITGEEGMDTMTLAKNLIKEVQQTDSNFSGKIAKISGDALNKKKVGATFKKLTNGALIIQGAGALKKETAEQVRDALEQEHSGIIVVLEDLKKSMDKLLKRSPALLECFNIRIDIEALDNDSLVAIAKKYAKDKEYSIDELGVLALHTCIAERQTSDHAVTVAEVKEIMEEAIRHANKKTLGHFFDILLAKRYDEEDMIILREKDFIQ